MFWSVCSVDQFLTTLSQNTCSSKPFSWFVKAGFGCFASNMKFKGFPPEFFIGGGAEIRLGCIIAFQPSVHFVYRKGRFSERSSRSASTLTFSFSSDRISVWACGATSHLRGDIIMRVIFSRVSVLKCAETGFSASVLPEVEQSGLA